MPLLLEADGVGWRLEIVGKLPELPPFIDVIPQFSVAVTGVLSSMRTLERTSQQLVASISGQLIEPLFFEQVAYDIHLEKSSDVSILLPPGAEARRIRPSSEHYVINFRNNVGFADIRINTPEGVVTLRIEVFSRKVDYRTDYVLMRDDVSRTLRNLAMTANAKSYSLAAPDRNHRPTLVEWFALLKEHFEELIKLTNAVARKPHSALTSKIVKRKTEQARKLSRHSISRALRRGNGGTVIPRLNIALPCKIDEELTVTTFDTPENRYYKGLLKATYRNVRALSRVHQTADEDGEKDSEKRFFESIRVELNGMERRLEIALKAPFLALVGEGTLLRPNSMVFHKHSAYSRIDKIARLLNGGLSFAGNIVPIGVKDTALLYEYWCFLKIVELLCEQFELEEQSIVKVSRFRTTVTLAKGVTAAMRFLHRPTGQNIYVVYNRLFNRLPTIAQKPDNVIQIASDNRFYIFDAKYRLQFDREYVEQYGGPGPTVEDINTMHRYRDAIAIPHPMHPDEYITGVVQGAVVLFPLPDEAAYQVQKFYKSISQVEIGGLPFLPRTTNLIKEKLLRIIDSELKCKVNSPY
ncbi:DUF2357 domain-containing protein [Pseudomonas mosselii]|uniref:DUF2357 domain-containing protein n=1 Tax=Pseudomonas mosselii TaxID=78327 RepID=UPI001F4C1627|nr:DUF2357 domain-containing protein [Pseudomonas mosselii]MCH7419408.1 restriction endonuclease-like protein [Pseudomonas mosselii]